MTANDSNPPSRRIRSFFTHSREHDLRSLEFSWHCVPVVPETDTVDLRNHSRHHWPRILEIGRIPTIQRSAKLRRSGGSLDTRKVNTGASVEDHRSFSEHWPSSGLEDTCRVKSRLWAGWSMPREECSRHCPHWNGWDRIDTFSAEPYSHRNRRSDDQSDIEHILRASDDSWDCI